MGRYFFAALMDVNGNNNPDSGEPVGFAIEKKYIYEADLIEVNQDISNVNITLYDVDLNISKVIVTPENPVVGQKISINATVVNLGGSFAEKFKVSLSVNGSVVDEMVLSIYFGEEKEAEFTLNLPAGTHELELSVDPDNRVPESNEENNRFSIEIAVSQPSEIWEYYDSDGDGKISTIELINAIKDWLNGKLSTMDLIKVIRKWLES